jgi:polysaccharide biosynthesis/export protein
MAAQLRRFMGLLAIAAMLATGACRISPGIKVSGSPSAGDDEPGEIFDPEIWRITPQLLARQRRERQERFNPGGNAPRSELRENYLYRVGRGDVLSVIVWNHPELSNPTGVTQNLEQQGRLVLEDGTIFFPFVGTIEAAGRSVAEIREEIATGLAPYIENPQVDVRVVLYRSQQVYVTGEVQTPGRVFLDDRPLTILDAVSVAGGFAETADQRLAYLTREGSQRRVDILSLYETGAADELLRDGDVLHIPDNRFNMVLVMGEVLQQTRVPMHKGRLSLAEALTAAAGIDLITADTSQIVVVRGEPVVDERGEMEGVRPVVYHLDARDAANLALAEGFELEPRDIVYVPATTAVRINRVLNQILPQLTSTIQAIWMTDRLIRDAYR